MYRCVIRLDDGQGNSKRPPYPLRAELDADVLSCIEMDASVHMIVGSTACVADAKPRPEGSVQHIHKSVGRLVFCETPKASTTDGVNHCNRVRHIASICLQASVEPLERGATGVQELDTVITPTNAEYSREHLKPAAHRLARAFQVDVEHRPGFNMPRRTGRPADAQGHEHSHVALDRKSTRLNSSHSQISYAVFCLKKNNYLHFMCSRIAESNLLYSCLDLLEVQ